MGNKKKNQDDMTPTDKFFETLVGNISFTLRPNIYKKSPKGPDLIGASDNVDKEGNGYYIWGWIMPDYSSGGQMLNVKMAKKSDQIVAQKMWKAGEIPKVDNTDPNFKLQNEEDLPI